MPGFSCPRIGQIVLDVSDELSDSSAMTKRTALEQKFHDEMTKLAAEHCLKRAKSIDGCAHFAREFSDALLKERRDSQRKDNGR